MQYKFKSHNLWKLAKRVSPLRVLEFFESAKLLLVLILFYERPVSLSSERISEDYDNESVSISETTIYGLAFIDAS